MPRRSIRFVLRRPGQDEEDEMTRKQNPFQENMPYTTLEFRFPTNREKREDITQDFFLRRPEDAENDLHPLRKQYLENRLKDLDYQERRQEYQDSFTTAMYGKKDYTQERNDIMEELTQGKKSVDPSRPSYEYNREQFWKDIHLQEERDKANGGRFETATLEEWKAKDEYYRKGLKTDHCNTALGTLLKEQGIDLPANESMNGIINFMNNSSEWQKLPRTEDGRMDHQTANDLAKEGYTVVFGYNNPEGHGHGGVLTGNPQMFESKNFTDENGKIPIPEVKGSIGSAEISTGHLGWHLTPQKEADTDYYVYKGNQDTEQNETQKNE